MKKGSLAVIFNKNKDQILLTKRRDVPLWVLPGGAAEPGESMEQALLREVYEETGMHVEIVSLVGVYTPINNLVGETFLYECREKSGEPQKGPETVDVRFALLNQLPEPFFFIHLDLIADTLSNEPKPLYRHFTKVTYWNLAKYFLKHPCWVIRFAFSRLGIPFNTK